MRTAFISTAGLQTAPRATAMRLQAEIADRQKEVSTGRAADVGLALGVRTGETLAMRSEHARLKATADANAIVAGRLDATQASLDVILKGAQEFLGALIDAEGSSAGADVLQGRAQAALAAFTGAANATHNGEHLFGGINTDAQPLDDYFGTPPSAGKAAVDAAFQAAFGMGQDDPAVVGIDPAAMTAFLQGDFADLFEAPSWNARFSTASDQPIRSRIASSELIASGTTANAGPMRALAKAYAMVADLGAAKLSPATYKALVAEAIDVVGAAVTGVTGVKAGLGTAQSRVTSANDAMGLQVAMLEKHIDKLEGVDPYEAATRVNALMTQIETSYALTARLQQLSLLDYL